MSETKERVVVYAKPNCKFCLGSGKMVGLHALCGEPVCHCVTEQLRIVTVVKDYGIPAMERYIPGQPEFIQASEFDVKVNDT